MCKRLVPGWVTRLLHVTEEHQRQDLGGMAD